MEKRALRVGLSYDRIESAPEISFSSEGFPLLESNWLRLFHDHGLEVRNRPMRPMVDRYYELDKQGRLVWIVARDFGSGRPVGYSGHYWYVDLHFCDKVAADDLWYVDPAFRGKGIGRRLREIGLYELRQQGVTATYDLIRDGGPDLTSYGYEKWGQRWMRKL